LATQGTITFAGNILEKGLGFAFVAIATRLVTPSEYGIFTLSLSIVMFFQGFASLNIYRSVDYFIPQHIDNSNFGQAKKTLQNVFAIGIVASIAGSAALFLFKGKIASIFDEPRLISILPILLFYIPLQTVLRTLTGSFNSIKKMKYRVLTKDFLNPFTRTLGAIILVSSGAGITGLVGGYLLGITIAVIFGFIFLINEARWILDAKPTAISNLSLFSYSLPLVLAGVIFSLVGQIDYFIIGYFLGSAEVGYYRVAFLLSGNILIALNAISPVFKPMVAENKFEASLLKDHYQLATRWVTMLTLPMAMTLAIAPEAYLSLLFTAEYSVAGVAVTVLVVGYLLNASFGPEGMVLEGLGYTKLEFLNTLILLIINGVLGFVLVPRYGILGAAIATGSALTLTGLVGVVQIYYFRSILPYSMELFRVWSALILPLVLGWYTSTLGLRNIQIAVVLPIVIVLSYLLGLRLTGGFTDNDREIAYQFDSKIGYPILSVIIGD